MGYFWGAKAASRYLKTGGSLINISSLAGKRGSANNSAYVATKFGVTGLTQSLSKELGPRGIRVNAICPVLIQSEGLLEALSEPSSPAKGNPESFLREFAENQSALKRLPTGQEVADLVLYLISEKSSAITGQSINVDCGVLPN
jgi:3-oxoacyl-[acyl-carrier protein] reductase/meso-butanediol dehydrogenase/(S,S)-butanediol dehydrogenase/diacetyl reductase